MKTLRLLLITLTVWMAGCGGGGGSGVAAWVPPAAQPDISNRIYVLAAHQGHASADSAAREFEIILTGVEANVDWYTDRPERLTGDSTTQTFVSTDWRRIYGGVAPNALLQYEHANGVRALFGSVQNVRYDSAERAMRIQLRLDQPSPELASSVGSLKVPVLTFLNNLTPPAVGSTFGLKADRSSLVADGPGRYRLVLTQVDERVLWMNNAPSRASDFESVGDFVNRWSERFSQVLPNASVAGDTGNGDYDILPLTLSAPQYDSTTRSISFSATVLAGAGLPDVSAALSNVVLFVDAGERSTPAAVFDQTWRGVAYSAIPAQFNSAPTGAFFDSDLTAENFQAVWGSKNGCGRNDLETMASHGINLIRLYDYNYQRGSSKWTSAGNGHIPFLDKAHSLGMKVIIPVSNYNFMRTDGANRPWDNIEHTVTQIVDSVKKNGAIHPAVHSFSVGNELDMDHYQMTSATLIPDTVRVVNLIHRLAPDHYITVPISNADEKKYYAQFRSLLPASLYQTRFYNSVQTFKPKDGGDLENNILKAYDNLGLGVPLVITELGTSLIDVGGSQEAKIDRVIGQASAVRGYMDAHPDSLVKGFAIFEWQYSHWKRGGGPDNADSTYGIQAYAGSLCQSNTGKFFMEGTVNGNYAYAGFHEDVRYDVDRLVPLTSGAHPEGLLKALSTYFK